ncbi:peroxidasin-like [Crassostrea angulata]|uniref:peroxidasin-like n=1 Tax=Magallana angulata TaxID=2784310 RepID=UPI0022B0881B|nr:peroxidasin-like [Crassostrea angulata]
MAGKLFLSPLLNLAILVQIALGSEPWQEFMEDLRQDVNSILQEDVCFPQPKVVCDEENIDFHNVRQSVFANLHKQSSTSRESIRRWGVLREFSQQLCDMNTFSLATPESFPQSPYKDHFNHIVCNRKEGPNCDWARSARYRTADGVCNNLINSRWGASNTVQRRMSPPQYQDEHSMPRGWGRNPAMPTPRDVSERLFSAAGGNETPNDDQNSLFLWSFGQFLDHDLTFTPTMDEDGRIPQCCADSHKSNISSGCFPLVRQVGGDEECMPFVRSAPAEEPVRPESCGKDFREQINELTSFIDLGNVYGNSYLVSKAMEAGVYGLMTTSNEGRSLPRGNPKDCKNGNETESYCQLAGDRRANEVPTLGFMHTIFLRFHNLVAKKLKLLNPHWTSNKIYLETRRILGAITQHITYNDWLPRVIGHSNMLYYGLYSTTPGQETRYVYYDTADPSMLNEFTTAAFRFAHSAIPAQLIVNDIKYKIDDILLDTSLIVANDGKDLKSVAKMLMSTPSKRIDRDFEEAIRERLFKSDGRGLDLPALNIQRGRDHGLAPYTKYKHICQQPFVGLPDHDEDSRRILMDLYHGNINDIDLFAAGISERSVSDGIVGPLFGCIIASQFQLLKYGDRYWYENTRSHPNIRFSPEQILAIKSMSFGKILCDVFSDDYDPMTEIPQNIFQLNQDSSMNCADPESGSRMNLESWREDGGVN